MKKAEEEARIEAERIARLPPPKAYAKRFNFRFENNLLLQGFAVEEDEVIVSDALDPATIIIGEVLQNMPYIIEDFPEDATDIPGTFDEVEVIPE